MIDIESVLQSVIDQFGLRRSLEQISRDFTFWKALPDRFGETNIKVSPGCGLRYWTHSLEQADPDLLRWAEDLIEEDSVVWDIGANLGIFSIAASCQKGVKKTLAFEPDLILVGYLRESIKANDLQSILEVLPVAVSRTESIAHLSVSNRSRARNRLAAQDDSQRASDRLVPTVSADLVLQSTLPPDFVKIDVEGAELLVLQGADRLLGEVRPTLVCEVSSENREAFTQTMKSYDYELFDAGKSDYPEVDSAVFDTLARPRD